MDYVNYFTKNDYVGNEFIIFFEHCIDKLISHHVPVQYEYMLDNAKLPIDQAMLNKYPFLEKVIFPRLKKSISDHKSYLEIEAMQLKMKALELYVGNKTQLKAQEKPVVVYNENGIIALNEKSYEAIRHKVLMLFLIEMIEINMKNHSHSINLDTMLNLSSFISYHIINSDTTTGSKYIFNINFSFDSFITLIYKDNSILLSQLEFWFTFYLPYLEIPIDNLQYEYFFSETSQFNTSDFKCKIQHLFCEYLTFIQQYLKQTQCINIIITITNNTYWIEETIERITNDPDTLINNIIASTMDKSNSLTLLSLMARMNQMMSFNHVILNYFGSCSNIKCNDILEQMIKMNNIKSLLVNFFEFNDYEYLHMVKMNEEFMKIVIVKTIELIGFLRTIVKKIKEKKGKQTLQLIAIQIKEFTSYKSYMKEIMIEMDRLIKDIINWKGIDVMISFSDVIENIEAFEAISAYAKGGMKRNENDLTYSNPSLFIDHSLCLIKISKQRIGQSSFYLTLFERDLKIMLNKTIDLYYIRSYTHNGLIPVTHITLGYFPSLNDLMIFLMKIPLSAMINLTKAKFFLRTNKGITNERLELFFSLNWPKKTLKSIKLIYETVSNLNAFDIFTFYDQCFIKKYFISNEPCAKPLISHQSLLPSLPKKISPIPIINHNKNNESSIFNPILQGNHSMLIEHSQSMSLLQKNTMKNTASLYPIELILFAQIDTYLQWKLNMITLYDIAININKNKSFEKTLDKRKLKDKFHNSIIVSEYDNSKSSSSLAYALIKYDMLHKTTILPKLNTKMIKNHFPITTTILQYTCRYFKGRRCFFNDFPNSSKIFNKYANNLSKAID